MIVCFFCKIHDSFYLLGTPVFGDFYSETPVPIR
jgi:hypothetical protein